MKNVTGYDLSKLLAGSWGTLAVLDRVSVKVLPAPDQTRTLLLLGLDDPDLYNPKTAKNLLLSSYSRQVALVGPNAAFVRAGSLASTYSDQPDWLAILDQLLDRRAYVGAVLGAQPVPPAWTPREGMKKP